MEVKNNILDRQYAMFKDEYIKKVNAILDSGWYVLGPEVKQFEEDFAKYNDAKYCVGLASGLDALILAFESLHLPKGSKVICPANTYIASVMGFTKVGLIPNFVEPDEYYNLDVKKIEEAIDADTKAICVVHLYGKIADMNGIMKLAKKYNLKVVEDCAQSHGASIDGKKCGTFGDIGCFSFYPTKLLGAFGDGGAIVTNNEKYADEIRMLRNYGSKEHYKFEVVGYNSRLDEIQAGLLGIKLKHLDTLIEGRRAVVKKYYEGIHNNHLKLMNNAFPIEEHVYHLFVAEVDDRDKFMAYCKQHGVGIAIHYPEPPHLSSAYKYLGYQKGAFPETERIADHIVSLPMYDGMSDEEIDYVISVINAY